MWISQEELASKLWESKREGIDGGFAVGVKAEKEDAERVERTKSMHQDRTAKAKEASDPAKTCKRCGVKFDNGFSNPVTMWNMRRISGVMYDGPAGDAPYLLPLPGGAEFCSRCLGELNKQRDLLVWAFENQNIVKQAMEENEATKED